MHVGVTFPQTEIGSDPVAIRDYAQAAVDLGYESVLVYDHVLGADPAGREGWRGYTHREMFHEPFVLFGYLTALAPTLELVTGVIILPQRQTALVAKQVAEVDVLSGGRLRLGVGVGWNPVEYEALNMDFSTRGRMIEEQVEVMRLLWTQPVVSYHGHWHQIVEAGINPLPVQRPIPVWMGGTADVLLRRVARMADGWFPQGKPEQNAESVEQLRSYIEAEGREPSEVGIEARISIRGDSPDEWARQALQWQELGATHISVDTMNAGLGSPQEHIEAIQRFKEIVSPVLR